MVAAAGLLVALFFALNIGASGTAASMGSVYGGRALPRRRALVLAAVFSFLGAWLGGGEVIRTVGTGIVPPQATSAAAAVVVLASAAVTLFTANLMGVPLSTSEVTVGAVVGAGIALGAWNPARVLEIALAWALLPPLALAAAYVLCRLAAPWAARLLEGPEGRRAGRVLAGVLVAGGCYESFAAGMNNVANAVGPLVGAGLMDLPTAQAAGGACLALGALLLGGRVLETNGRRITTLSLVSGGVASVTAGTLVILASANGIPVPLTQATTVAIIGAGLAVHGRRGIDGRVVRRVLEVWILSPLISLVVCWLAVQAVERSASAGPAALAAGGAVAAALVVLAAALWHRHRREERSRGAPKSAGRGGDGRVPVPSRHHIPSRPAERGPGARPVPGSERTVLLHDAGRPRG